MGMRCGLGLAAVAAATFLQAPASAEWSASLPIPAACTVVDPPKLPNRWHAVALMLPFSQGQLDVGEFVYDGTLRAMRATVYGLESGAIDLLITEGQTYRLAGPYDAPTHCTSVGRGLRLPTRQWLSDQAVCIGEMRLATQDVQWWKAPGADTQASYHWFKRATRLPWRSLFLSRSRDPAIIGDYAMSYFPTFTPLRDTQLAALVDLCGARTQDGNAQVPTAVPTARELMTIRNEAAEVERKARIGTLIPGLSHDACSRMTTPGWPEQFVMTAMLTPIRFQDEPNSSLIYYDWRQHQTQLQLMFQGRPPVIDGLISLKKNIGYRMLRRPSGGMSCEPVFPGIVRPDWMSVAGCQCKGTIDRHPEFGPDAEMQILSCPIKWKGPRIMWNMYRADGRPVVFFEAAPGGAGLMLADYQDWAPGATAQPHTLELPDICKMPDSSGLPSNPASNPMVGNPSCSDCHTNERP